MKMLFPGQTLLDGQEVYRINRIRIAQFLGITPATVDAMPASDVEDVLGYLWAFDEQRKKRSR